MPYSSLRHWHDRYADWLVSAALPLWAHAGTDLESGGFQELLGMDGRPVASPRRARVQGRQSYAFAVAGYLGWNGPWADRALHGLDYLDRRYRRDSGLFCTEIAADGTVANPAEFLYDQTFALLAAAWIGRLMPERAGRFTGFARDLFATIAARRHPQGGFRETGDPAFLSNPHMHLFEAMLAWFETSGEDAWKIEAEKIAALCLAHFVDAKTMSLHEYFDENWRLLPGDQGRSVEPGHQFEWAWLMMRWARLTGSKDARKIAFRLFEVGQNGIDPVRNAAMDEMDDSFAVRRARARLWPQTERLKAALILAEETSGADQAAYITEATAAAAGLWRYLETPLPGLWRDKLNPDDRFVDGPAPASSLYHIICAIMTLRDTLGKLPAA
jgi:mannose-1-phosphate guanylyltransferase / mannose-6-phosphate isomerase